MSISVRPSPGTYPFAKTIHMLWFQGMDAAPELVRLNAGRWRDLNPGWKLNILDRAGALAYLPDPISHTRRLSRQALSDILRINLLLREGGVWTDATVFPVSPLDDWLPARLGNEGIFAFSNPGPDRELSSWFLSSAPGAELCSRWKAAIDTFWTARRGPAAEPRGFRKCLPIPDDPVAAIRASRDRADGTDNYHYYWLHYLFAEICDADPALKAAWASCTPWPTARAQALRRYLHETPEPSRAGARHAAHQAPVQKLDWRRDWPIEILAAL